MLKTYGELIEKLLKNITNGDADVSLIECLQIAGNGILLMIILLLLISVLSGVFVLPTKAYHGFLKQNILQLEQLINEPDYDNALADKISKAIKIKRIAYWLFFVVIYLPVCIPVVLYLFSLIFK